MSKQEQVRRREQPGIGVATAYGALQFPLGLLIPPLTSMVPGFFAETMGMPLAVVGTISGLMRFYHVASDPLCGALSDRTRGRWGRRRPWMVAGAAILMLGVWLTFMPPVRTASPAYFAMALLFVYSGCSLIQIPYYAWGAELPSTPFGKARMLGLREVLGVIGLMLSAMAPLLASLLGFKANGREALSMLGVAVLVLVPAMIGILFLRVREAPIAREDAGGRGASRVLIDFWDALRFNRPFRIELSAALIANVGLLLWQSINYFYLSQVLHLEKMFGVVALAAGVCAVVTAPLWIWLSRRFEIHRLIAGAMLAGALIHVFGFALLPVERPLVLLSVEIPQSIALVASLILAPALQAMSIDYGTYRSGVDRAGTYVSLTQLTSGIASAFPFLIVFPLLAWAGFDPAAIKAGAAVNPDGLFALRVMGIYGAAPMQILGALVFARYPITRAEAARIGAALAQARGDATIR